MRRSHFYAPVLSFLYWFIPLQTSKQTSTDTRILARTCLTLAVGANCCTWVPLFELCQPEQDYPCCRTPLKLLDYSYGVPGLAADEGLSSEQPCCHRIATSSTKATPSRLLCPSRWLALLKPGIYFSMVRGMVWGKIQFILQISMKRNIFFGPYSFLFLSSKLQSSLVFKGNDFYELVISSGGDSAPKLGLGVIAPKRAQKAPVWINLRI